MNKNWPSHLYNLDVSRGIAALTVVLWHWKFFAIKNNVMPSGFEPESQPLYNILRLFYENGSMGVKYFFLLSGFIFFWLFSQPIKTKKISAWTFSIQRFARLYPLHFITLLCVSFFQFIYTYREGYSFAFPFNDMYHFLLNLGFASKWGFQKGASFNAPVWSVSIEVLLYVIFFGVAFFRQVGWFFCLLVSVLSFILTREIYHPVVNALAMFFLGGGVFFLTAIIVKKNYMLTQLIYCLTIFFWWCVIFDYYIFNLSDYILSIGRVGKIFLIAFPQYLLFPLTVCSLALHEINKGSFLKPISWVGDITYSSYLLHFPLQLLFALAVSFGVLSSNFYLSPIYLVVYFVTLIPLSYITYIKFEKPMQRIIKNKMLPSKA